MTIRMKHSKKSIAQAARDLFEDKGVIEFDDRPRISKSADSGYYVQAWVYVDALDIEEKISAKNR